ncbi:MAG: prolipoprotein diacylglyceryl transferase, partial [Elusimicrobia bacterium]|nr:prolipoprotein diacylglyceryl transferase [Elusimicrobiota bacterium]
MYPLLLQIGPIALYSYGFFTASGFLTATYYIVKVSNKAPSTPQNTKQLGNTRPTPPHTVLSEDAVYGLIFACIIGGVLGARLTYVLLNLGSFRDNILSVFKVWEGGLVFYGGFLTAF